MFIRNEQFDLDLVLPDHGPIPKKYHISATAAGDSHVGELINHISTLKNEIGECSWPRWTTLEHIAEAIYKRFSVYNNQISAGLLKITEVTVNDYNSTVTYLPDEGQNGY